MNYAFGLQKRLITRAKAPFSLHINLIFISVIVLSYKKAVNRLNHADGIVYLLPHYHTTLLFRGHHRLQKLRELVKVNNHRYF